MNKPTDSYNIKGILANYGFCIKKALYSQNAICSLKTFFNVKPKLMYEEENPDKEEDTSFDVYFEDDTYLVIPKFFSNSFLKIDFTDEKSNFKYDKIIFSISKVQYKQSEINFNFTGKLRDYQLTIVNSVLKSFGFEYNNDKLIKIDNTLKPKGGIIQLSTGAGKCLGKDTGVLLFDGTIKKVQDIIVGDLLMGDDSTPRCVKSLARGREIMYKVNCENGHNYIVNKSHILSLRHINQTNNELYNISKETVMDISVEDYLKLSSKENYFGYRVPIIFEEKNLPIDPYLYGYWLGIEAKYNIIYSELENNTNDTNDKQTHMMELLNDSNFKHFLKENNLLQDKHIIHNYKCNSRENQLILLAGIIDCGGIYRKNNSYEIIEQNQKLLNDVIYLSRSLGFATFKQVVNFNENDNTDAYYKLVIYGKGLEEIPVLCLTKKSHSQNLTMNHLNYKIKLEELKEDDYYGFEIDGNRRFVLEDFSVTHNTVLAIYLAYILKLKTLIIVHQEFLQDQWIERFKMFTNAKIGSIRGSIIDTENKDVVIGMLQSISIKDYEDSVFSNFGLVIYDEVHHFGSRVFSRALLKTSAKYNIGLSATPERTDGLIKVVKWFTGDILYKMEKKYDYKVLVKKIYFRSNDETYKEKKNWIKGQIRPNHIKMTENLMNNKTRNKLMIKSIDCLRSMGRTIFVISSRVEHLQILKNGVDLLIAQAGEQHIYNTYYYIGPTKKGQKKMAEKDGNIIFATIQLASEALDIPRLDTIVLALPIKQDKTLIQSIGRILRNDKLESLTQIPVVVDLSDILSIYQKWSEKRNSVYAMKNWFVQNYYWEDETYLYRGKENKDLKPLNIIFDDIGDEDFIEKNLIIKPEDIIKEKEVVLNLEDDSSSKTESSSKTNKFTKKVKNVEVKEVKNEVKNEIKEAKPVYVFKGKNNK
jgi:superfamily II DNA or RNA helicase